MSISKSYNKQNGTYYAYETQYVFDETRQRKVQKRRCIGKYDPQTNEIIPTSKRGRPPKNMGRIPSKEETRRPGLGEEFFQKVSKLSSRLDAIESMMAGLASEFHLAKNDYDEIIKHLPE